MESQYSKFNSFEAVESQGSVLGPTLDVVYTYDNSKLTQVADDSVLLAVAQTSEKAANELPNADNQ